MNQIHSYNPSSGKLISSIEATPPEDIPGMVERAHKAQKLWKKFTIQERGEILSEILENMKSQKEYIAQTLSEEMGMPIRQARDEAEYGFMYFQGYLEMCESALSPKITKETEIELHTVFYEPKGVVLSISPWNYPFSMAIWITIQILLAGNAIIFKTSKEVALTGKLYESFMKHPKLPDGIFTEVYGSGELGDTLLEQDIQAITFTGSTEVGRSIYQKAASKFIPCVMELGGSAPGIICADADIDTVLETIYFLRFSNSGQMCDGLKRLIVHESRYSELIEKLSHLLSTKKMGEALLEETDIGPMVSDSQKERAELQLQDALDKGASILGEIPYTINTDGAFIRAVLLGNITPDMKVWSEEVFAPILPVVSFTTLEEAIELGNDTDYGLGAYVFTEDMNTFQHIAAELETGEIQHNTLNYCIPENPFGGYKLSGLGREHGQWGFHEFCNIKVTSQMK